ncbi:hypothetical protein C8J56DRAFT_796671, partial [Mycena floridula]
KASLKWILMTVLMFTMVGTAILSFGDVKDKYWRLTCPGVVIGTSGISVIFVTANIAIFKVTPPEVAGTVGTVFNCVLKLGSAAGVAIRTSIQTNVEDRHGGPTSPTGRSVALWFLFVVSTSLAYLFFMDNDNSVKLPASKE